MTSGFADHGACLYESATNYAACWLQRAAVTACVQPNRQPTSNVAGRPLPIAPADSPDDAQTECLGGVAIAYKLIRPMVIGTVLSSPFLMGSMTGVMDES
ncbi:hypothetical protein KO481_26410 [Nocardia sp. NEAU-G5]|uniref:Uncharacterized protein n=1 Tax=Nocardia albiluteola TaxID=2842303 RepID=A0ABS6B6M4_9NOCA|nr:hypothetical protein [Nocardia albiluteola]MBU3065051.1 hypothetical protein [Nocardia albiluteola]